DRWVRLSSMHRSPPDHASIDLRDRNLRPRAIVRLSSDMRSARRKRTEKQPYRAQQAHWDGEPRSPEDYCPSADHSLPRAASSAAYWSNRCRSIPPPLLASHRCHLASSDSCWPTLHIPTHAGAPMSWPCPYFHKRSDSRDRAFHPSARAPHSSSSVPVAREYQRIHYESY